MKQEKMDQYFMRVAQLTAELSYAKRKKVGAVLAKDNRIVSVGFNGTPKGWPNECEDILLDGSLVTKSCVVHAEANALFWCAKTEIITNGTTMYLTLSPCATCALGLIQSGVSRVVYLEAYRDLTGVEVLKKAGIQVEQLQLSPSLS